jgi:hypothetical protein
MLAERGTHVGAEEMIERVEAVMADDPLVVVTKQRKGIEMSVRTDDMAVEEGRKRPGWVWALAGFAVVVAVGAVYLALDGLESGEPAVPAPNTTIAPTETTTAPTTTLDATATTSSEERLGARVQLVEAMVAARNSGDYGTWRAFFPDEAPNIFGTVIGDESEPEWQRSYVAANDVWTITGTCRDGIDRVRCPMTLVNDFLGPAGISYTVPNMEIYFTPEDEMTGMGAEVWSIDGDPEEYADAFDAWLAVAYPEVHAGFGPRVEGEGGLPNAEDMPTAIQYVDEFVAQSDDYPVGG